MEERVEEASLSVGVQFVASLRRWRVNTASRYPGVGWDSQSRTYE